MRQERLYVLVGLFVGGAISLSILIGLFIYDEYLHEKVETYVLFFKGSLSGIQISSDVTYRGVKIGEVKLIEITESADENHILIPVYVQFFVERKFVGKQNPIQRLVKRNYVAAIKQPNFLTGVASIELIKEPGMHNMALTTYNSYPVFPTSNKAEIHTSLDDAFTSAKKAFEDVSNFIQSARVNDVLDATKTLAVSVDKTVRNFNHLFPTSIATFNQSLKQFSNLTRDLDIVVPTTLTSVSKSIKEVSEAANSTQTNFLHSMRQVSDAANSTQNLMDYLSRYPESLLRGKK